MSIGSYLVARAARLGPARFRVTHKRNIRVKMRDGLALETDLFVPRNGVRSPTILMRVPYGVSNFAPVAEIYAERGFTAVLQGVRGTGKSDGEFDPLSHERDDGLDTLDWIKAQPWYDGRIGLSGPSYLGYAQWAISDALPRHAAMSVKVTSAEFRSVVFPGGTFNLALLFGWMQVMEGLRNPLRMMRRMSSGGIEKRSLRASMRLPLIDADKRMTGRTIPFWKRWLSSRSATTPSGSRSTIRIGSGRARRRPASSAAGTISCSTSCCATMRRWPMPGCARASPSGRGRMSARSCSSKASATRCRG